jgi:rhodanese-related sulfurtransferase
MIREVTARELDGLCRGAQEFALLDVRDGQSFVDGHLLLAVNVPVGDLAERTPGLVPRRGCPIVLCAKDAGQGTAARAVLEGAGYGEVSVLAGGVDAWRAKGGELYCGTYILNNALALYTERHCGTPRRDAGDLAADRQAGRDVVVIDTRSFEEFHGATVPGAVHVPLAEVGGAVAGLVRDGDTEVVVTCGGRARAVLGCQTLRDLGVGNQVSALYYGTTGWDLADQPLEAGASRSIAYQRGSDVQHAATQAERLGVEAISPDALAAWKVDATRTSYIVDVRGAADYAAGHVEGARWIPGGQLASVTEDHIATRNARIVLIDDDDDRAWITAAWMRRLGWRDICVVSGGVAACRDAGMTMVVEAPPPPQPSPGDGVLVPGDRETMAARHDAARRVIEVREALLDQVTADGTVTFAH